MRSSLYPLIMGSTIMNIIFIFTKRNPDVNVYFLISIIPIILLGYYIDSRK